jgi:cerevisin
MIFSLCLSFLVASVVATPLSTPHDIPRQRSPLALAPFHTLQAEHPDKVLNNSYIIMLKGDLHSSAIDNHFNFLQVAHEEDPLLAAGPVGVSQVYNGHLKGYAGRFTDSVIQRIREMPEVAYVEQDSIVHALDTQRFAPWVRCSASVVA